MGVCVPQRSWFNLSVSPGVVLGDLVVNVYDPYILGGPRGGVRG